RRPHFRPARRTRWGARLSSAAAPDDVVGERLERVAVGGRREGSELRARLVAEGFRVRVRLVDATRAANEPHHLGIIGVVEDRFSEYGIEPAAVGLTGEHQR